MDVILEIEALIKSSIAANQAGQFDPAGFLDDAGAALCKACLEKATTDPVGDSSPDLHRAYSAAASFLSNYGLTWAAEQLVLEWWDMVGQRQLKQDRHIYRAATALMASQLYMQAGDRGAALRWVLLCQADDLLHEHGLGGGKGRQLLRTRFHMTQAELAQFKQIASHNLAMLKSKKTRVSRAAWFAEDVIVEAAQLTSFAHFFSQPTAVHEFPLSKAYFAALLNHLGGKHTTAKSKGDALEDIASYLLLLIPGWIPRRNAYGQNQGPETDIVVSNFSTAGDVTSELFGRHFIVECKNTGDPVDVQDVGYFLYRMKLAHCKFGVMFATRGVTGKTRGETAARSLIRQAFHEDGITCIVLARHDLDSLAQGATRFLPLLLKSIDIFRFGEPRQTKKKP